MLISTINYNLESRFFFFEYLPKILTINLYEMIIKLAFRYRPFGNLIKFNFGNIYLACGAFRTMIILRNIFLFFYLKISIFFKNINQFFNKHKRE